LRLPRPRPPPQRLQRSIVDVHMRKPRRRRDRPNLAKNRPLVVQPIFQRIEQPHPMRNQHQQRQTRSDGKTAEEHPALKTGHTMKTGEAYSFAGKQSQVKSTRSFAQGHRCRRRAIKPSVPIPSKPIIAGSGTYDGSNVVSGKVSFVPSGMSPGSPINR
jgi:hypothetical protein